MNHFENILVVIDPVEEEQKALKRAIEIAQRYPCKITLLLTTYDLSYEMTTMLSSDERDSMKHAVIEDRQAWLELLASENHADLSNTDIKIEWHNRPYETIIKNVLTNKHDLVVKGTHKHDVLKSVIFTPTDWHLLRKCPCPVLLVKDHEWPDHGQVLAAVNVGSIDPHHDSLNTGITAHTKWMSELLNADAHLVNTYPPSPISMTIEVPEFDHIEYNKTLKNHHKKALKKLAEDFDIENLHLLEGLPEDIIPEVASQIDAELVVMGTIGRTGISAALIGNTAEHVIDNLNCDLLAIKPDDFECPITIN